MRNKDYLSKKDKEAMRWVEETGSIESVEELARVLECTPIIANTILQRLQALDMLEGQGREKEVWE